MVIQFYKLSDARFNPNSYLISLDAKDEIAKMVLMFVYFSVSITFVNVDVTYFCPYLERVFVNLLLKHTTIRNCHIYLSGRLIHAYFDLNDFGNLSDYMHKVCSTITTNVILGYLN